MSTDVETEIEADTNAQPWYDTSNPWYMAGTENTGQYVVVAETALGRVGFRQLGGSVRVRIEPFNAATADQLGPKFPAAGRWRQPGCQRRFSIVVPSDQAITTVERALKALGRQQLARNPKARYWRKPLRAAA